MTKDNVHLSVISAQPTSFLPTNLLATSPPHDQRRLPSSLKRAAYFPQMPPPPLLPSPFFCQALSQFSSNKGHILCEPNLSRCLRQTHLGCFDKSGKFDFVHKGNANAFFLFYIYIAWSPVERILIPRQRRPIPLRQQYHLSMGLNSHP